MLLLLILFCGYFARLEASEPVCLEAIVGLGQQVGLEAGWGELQRAYLVGLWGAQLITHCNQPALVVTRLVIKTNNNNNNNNNNIHIVYHSPWHPP